MARRLGRPRHGEGCAGAGRGQQLREGAARAGWERHGTARHGPPLLSRLLGCPLLASERELWTFDGFVPRKCSCCPAACTAIVGVAYLHTIVFCSSGPGGWGELGVGEGS